MDNENNEDKDIESSKTKKNDLNTKCLPPLFMLSAGVIALFICFKMQYSMKSTLTALLITLFSFAVIGTIVKTIVDSFNMKNDYFDFLDDEGAIREKNDE